MRLCFRRIILVWSKIWNHIWRSEYDRAGNRLSSWNPAFRRLRTVSAATHDKAPLPGRGESDCWLCDRWIRQCFGGAAACRRNGVRFEGGIVSWCNHGNRNLLHANDRMGRGKYASEAHGCHRSCFDRDWVRAAIRPVLDDVAWNEYWMTLCRISVRVQARVSSALIHAAGDTKWTHQ